MKALIFALTGLVFASASFAGDNNKEIYKTYDAAGNVVFTDKRPNDEAQPLALKPLNTVPAHVVRGKTTAEAIPQPGATKYRDLAITNPIIEETLWNTAGRVPVSLRLAGELLPGDQLFLVLDGKPRSVSGLRAQLTGIERGTHTLSAQILNASGAVQAQTEPFEFYIKQHSIRHNRP